MLQDPRRGSGPPPEPPAEVGPDGRDGPDGAALGWLIGLLVVIVAGVGFLLMG